MINSWLRHSIIWLAAVIIFLPHAAGMKPASEKPQPQPPSERETVQHPDSMKFDPLDWKIPFGKSYRTVLKNGPVAYVAVDSSLPMITIEAHIRYGSLEDPKQKHGIGSLMVKLLRTGGTEKYSADSLDALIDQLAMKFSFSQSESHITFKTSFLSEYMDTALDIMEQMFYHPRFQPEKIEKEKTILKEHIRHRFVNPGPALNAAYRKLMYPQSSAARLISAISLDSISRDDLITLHEKVFKKRDIVLAASGKFDRKEMITDINTIFRLYSQEKRKRIPEIKIAPKSQGLVVDKNINQTYVRMGLPLFKRPHKDYYPVSVLNVILGGGGFTSRLTTKIRSDEGLTYSIYSHSESNYLYPGTIYIDFYTKTESFPRAVSLVLEEIRKIREKGVTEQELENAKAMLISQLPSMFRSPEDIVSTYALNEFFGRSPDHFTKYSSTIRGLRKKDIDAAARKYLDTSNLTYTVVGDTSALLKKADGDFFSLTSLETKKVISTDSLSSLP